MYRKLAWVAGIASCVTFSSYAMAGSIYTEDANWNFQAFNPFASANGLTIVSSGVTAPYIYAATSSNDGATYIASSGTADASGDFPPGTPFTALGTLRLDNLYLPNAPYSGTGMAGVTGTSGTNGVDALLIFAVQGVSGTMVAPGYQSEEFIKGAYAIVGVQGGSFVSSNLSTWGSLTGPTPPGNLLTAGIVAYGHLIPPQSVLPGNPSSGTNTGYTDTPSPGAFVGNTDQVTGNGSGQYEGSAVATLNFTGTGVAPNLLTNISTFSTSGAFNPGLFLDNIFETTVLGGSLSSGQYGVGNNIYKNVWAIAGLSGTPVYAAGTTNIEDTFNATFAVPDATPAPVPEPPSSSLAWSLIAVGVGGWIVRSRRKKQVSVDCLSAAGIRGLTPATANRACKRAV